jgi:lysophospholipase L1-like esterase
MKNTISLVSALAFAIGLLQGIVEGKRVACVGDSDTYGYGLSRQNAYPGQLELILQRYDQRWEVGNFGRNGATVLRLGDLPYVSQWEYQQALAYEPNIVIFEFGGNGARSQNRGYIQEHYANDYIGLIDAFSTLDSKPEIWLCQPLDKILWNSTIARILREEIMPITARVAMENNLPVIDFYDVFKDAHHLYQSDGIHPTVEGSRVMAEMVAAAILGRRWPPDFNGDSKVNLKDLVILIENWGQDEPSLDIAPPPVGDGVIDVQDLEILMSFWEQEPNDHTLTAHWRMNEIEGVIAFDTAGQCDGTLHGDPTWKPEDGMVDGALAFDGIDDYVGTPLVLDPSDGTFSVFGWIKGAAPGQVVASQQGGVNWLMADRIEGALRTDLKVPATAGRGAIPAGPPLISQSVVTDGYWHRVGFVWDGINRILYVDDIEVARDTAEGLESAYGGLYLGAGSTLAPGTFFSGLIDDVRIYNRVVKP